MNNPVESSSDKKTIDSKVREGTNAIAQPPETDRRTDSRVAKHGGRRPVLLGYSRPNHGHPFGFETGGVFSLGTAYPNLYGRGDPGGRRSGVFGGTDEVDETVGEVLTRR